MRAVRREGIRRAGAQGASAIDRRRTGIGVEVCAAENQCAGGAGEIPDPDSASAGDAAVELTTLDAEDARRIGTDTDPTGASELANAGPILYMIIEVERRAGRHSRGFYDTGQPRYIIAADLQGAARDDDL